MHSSNDWQDTIGNKVTLNNALDYQIITIIKQGML